MSADKKWFSKSGRQSGATAVEFALVFPIMFAIFYSAIFYGYVFYLQQRINFAAQEGLRAAIAVDPASAGGGYMATVMTQATFAVNNAFTLGGATLPPGLQGPTFAFPPAGTALTSFSIRVGYSLITPPVFPLLNLSALGFAGSFPPLPNDGVLIAQATGQL